MPYTPPPNQSAYYEQVWDLARQVPPGRVVTYGQIAQMIAPPAGLDPQEYKAWSPRWVGDAMAACPDDVPWQRVINAQGKISERPGAQRQRHLLEGEGIVFVNDKVDLKRYQWQGPGHEDTPQQATLF
ncbi:MAG TPA: MGMT family protein [Caldilineaceae bacterium]|nr:MGMT family protein [Caldilineaceae bacterium]